MTATMTRPALEFKTFHAIQTKAVDPEKGIVEALVAVTGNTDDGGDVILPGAFKFKRSPKIVWSHDLNLLVGKVLDYAELKPGDDRLPQDLQDKNLGALWFRIQFDLEDPESFKAYRKVVFHEDLGWSIGYETPAGGAKKLPDGRRALANIVVWEASPTTFGMNEEARTVSVKSLTEKTVDELGLSEEKAQAIRDLIETIATPEPDGTKAWPPLAGSFEDLVERCLTAVEAYAVDQYGERSDQNWWYCMVEGTFDSDVVATIRLQGEESVTLRFPYTEADDGSIELGDPEQVTVQTVVSSASGSTGLEGKKAVPKHSTDTSTGAWDGPANEKRVLADQEASYYRNIYAWQDPEGDVGAKSTWKFIHHEVSSDGTPGAANMKACATAMGVLNGGRGVDASAQPWSKDREAIHAHLAAHMADADMEAPELKSLEEKDVDLRDLAAILAEVDPDGIEETKAGRVLSEANASALQRAAEAIQNVLEAAAPKADPEGEKMGWSQVRKPVKPAKPKKPVSTSKDEEKVVSRRIEGGKIIVETKSTTASEDEVDDVDQVDDVELLEMMAAAATD